MSEVTIPADGRIQVVTQDMLDGMGLTIRNDETGEDARLFGSENDESRGFPLRQDDEIPIRDGKRYNFGDSDGIWIETETSSETTIQVLKGVEIDRNQRRDFSATIDADTSGLLKTSDQPLDVSDTPVAVSNLSTGSQKATTTSTGQSNAATVSVPDGRSSVTAAWDLSGAATITVEVSPDGGSNWYQEYQTSPGSAETGTYNFTTGFDDVRVFVDTNLNSASIGAKGA